MKSESLKYYATIFILLFLPAFYGCPGTGTPTITLTAIDCKTNDITVTDSTKVISRPGNEWLFSTTITVKCNGKVVKDAELKVKFWFKDAIKRKTNKNGQISYRDNFHANPKGEKFKVTIEGKDGDKTQEFTVQ